MWTRGPVPYDITPLEPSAWPMPGLKGLYVGYSFSGHGFKSAPAIDRVLAQSIPGQTRDVSIESYSLDCLRKAIYLRAAIVSALYLEKKLNAKTQRAQRCTA